jgi:hypothetical protein
VVEHRCELTGVCAGQERTTTCYEQGSRWDCTCSEGFAVSIADEAVGDEACRRALGYCGARTVAARQATR